MPCGVAGGDVGDGESARRAFQTGIAKAVCGGYPYPEVAAQGIRQGPGQGTAVADPQRDRDIVGSAAVVPDIDAVGSKIGFRDFPQDVVGVAEIPFLAAIGALDGDVRIHRVQAEEGGIGD